MAAILMGLNSTFWHQTVMGAQIEQYISTRAGVNLSKVFDQYLRTTMVPTFEYGSTATRCATGGRTSSRASTCRSRVTLDWPTMAVIHPTEAWQSVRVKLPNAVRLPRRPELLRQSEARGPMTVIG